MFRPSFKFLNKSKNLLRWMSSSLAPHPGHPAPALEKLESRGILRVSGSDASQVLQGLITNDIFHLTNPFSSLYTLFLNSKGRVLFDSIIYTTAEKDTYLIECDRDAVLDLEKHLKVFRIRRKADVVNLSTQVNVWALFHPNYLNLFESLPNLPDLSIYSDPRVGEMGNKIIVDSQIEIKKLQELLQIKEIDQEYRYKYHRYKLGVGEGIVEIPPGHSFPLESNCDYMHGISFHKGCYLGQELTARTHHTGVVRKRLMPINFIKPSLEIKINDPVTIDSDTKTKIGKLRGTESNLGLALIRVQQALNSQKLLIGNAEAVTSKPTWWPIEAPKDLQSLRSKN